MTHRYPSSFLSASLRLCAILSVANLATAADPFVWKWAQGDSARYQMTQTVTMSMDAGPAGQVSNERREDKVLVWKVDSVEGDTAKLSQSTERVVMQSSGQLGQSFRYDSNDEEPPAGMAALLAPMFEAMVAHPILLSMAPTGAITEVTLSDELAEALKRLPGGGVSDETVIQATKQGSLTFPEGPLEVGEEWSNEMRLVTPQMGEMKVTMSYVYQGPKEVDGRTLDAFKPNVTMEPVAAPAGAEVEIDSKTGDGEVLFDREAGRLVRSEVTQDIEVRVKIGDQNAVSKVRQSTQMTELPEGQEPDLPEAEDADEPEQAGAKAGAAG